MSVLLYIFNKFQNLRTALIKTAFALGFTKRSVITLLCSFEKSCLPSKIFVEIFVCG